MQLSRKPSTSRRNWLSGAGGVGAWAALGSLGLSACSTAPNPALAASERATEAAALAPGGRLRACINLGNPILARRSVVAPSSAGAGSVADAEVSGVSVDLARALAERLGLPLELIVVDAAAKSVETVRSGQADIGFFAIDPARSEGLRFTAPYVIIEGAYLVRDASPLKANEEVDMAGNRVMVGRGSAYDLFLSRSLKAAQILRAPTSPTVVERMLAEHAEVAAGVKQQLQADAARQPGLRLLPGRFMVIEQAMGLPANRGEAAQAALHRFVEQAKASGFVQAALRKHGIEGALVAPATGR